MNPFIERKKEVAQARKAQIMDLIHKKPLSVADVVQHFDVSVATARNDLNALNSIGGNLVKCKRSRPSINKYSWRAISQCNISIYIYCN